MRDQTLQLLHNPAAIATTLLVISIDRFGVECLDWHSRVLEEELMKLAPKRVPPRNFDKLHSLILAITTDRVWNEPKIFMVVANALAPDGPNMFPTFNPSDTAEIAWAVAEMRLNDPVADQRVTKRFSDEVLETMQFIKDREMALNPDYLTFLDARPINSAIGQGDPGLEGGVWVDQVARRDAVDAFVGRRMAMLMVQLGRIQLQSGDTSGLQPMIDKITAEK